MSSFNHQSFSLCLSQVPWNMFATLTYADVPGRVETVQGHMNVWLQKVARVCFFGFDRMKYVVRVERGEGGSHRLHAHALLIIPFPARGYFIVPHGCVPQAHNMWGRGMTSFREVRDGGDPIVPYVLKGGGGADNYEFSKTASGNELVVSDAAFRCARRLLKRNGGWSAGLGVGLAQIETTAEPA